MRDSTLRRGFLQRLAGVAGLSALAGEPLAAQSGSRPEVAALPLYARTQNYKSTARAATRTGIRSRPPPRRKSLPPMGQA
jgi:hypothetical protein